MVRLREYRAKSEKKSVSTILYGSTLEDELRVEVVELLNRRYSQFYIEKYKVNGS